jgi:aromatic ring-opening dioxygenase catalytic subunit (LigB family)
MAEIVMAYSAAHAPMQAADPGSAPPEQGVRWFDALKTVREQAQAANPQAVVMLSGEHFTNYFLDCLPQLAVGLADKYETPDARWLKMEGAELKGEPTLAYHITDRLMADRWWPALSYEMEPDHGFLTVYHQLDPTWGLPLVPLVMNCTTPPLMTMRHAYEFGISLGEAIRSYQGLDRVVLVGGGGVSHFVGEPRVGDIDEEFDRWFLEELRKPDLGELLDLPNDELMEAGNGTGEVRAWVAIAGAMRGQPPTVLSYEPIYEWINGMAVVSYAKAG